MANQERYITVVELNSQQAQDRLKELEKKVKDLKKAKEDAIKSGGFFDEKELKKATRELNQWKIQIQGVQAVLENINDATMLDLQKSLRKLRDQSKTALPGSEEANEINRAIYVIENQVKKLKNEYKETADEAQRVAAASENLSRVLQNIEWASLNQLQDAQKWLEENIAKMDPVGAKAQSEYLVKIKQRIAEIKAEQDKVNFAIDKYNLELKSATKSMDTMQRESELVERTMANLSRANVRDLEYSIKIVNEQLREMPRGTREFDRLQEKAKALRTELERVRFEGAAQQGWLSRTADFFNKIQGALIAGVGAITGLTFTIRKCVQAFADMDQEMESVRKYTGQTTEEVHQMNEEFKKMDTRTTREKLNQLAGDAGRLGITSKQAIMEFVDAADKINVALGDDLGDEAVKQIGKLAMSFGTDKTMGLRGAMLATGSAVNELAQNSSASAGYLVEFTARVAGFAKQIGLTQAQLMGFGAVMDENMLKDEMAATAFGQLLVKMTTDLDTFAKITGMKVEEYRKLVTEDINGAVLAVARSLKGRDMEDLGHVFDAMHLNGQRAIGVLSTLGQKAEDVAERQRIATEAFEEGNSVINEFNIQNETAQAQLEKARKRFNDLSVELGEKLMPIARYAVSTGALMVKGLSTLISFVGKYAGTLTMLTGTIIVLVAWKEKDVIWTKLQVFWNEKLLVATKRLWAALLAHPYAAIAAAVAVVVGYLIDLNRRTDDAAAAQEKMNKIRDDAKKRIISQRDYLEMLIKASKNDKISLEDRLSAIDKLEKQIPGYITQLDRETGKYKENKKALDDYLKSLTRKYELEGAKDMLRDLGKEIADATLKVNRAKKAADAAANAGPGTTYTTSYGAVGNTTEDLKDKTNRDLSAANRELQNKLQQRDEILKAYGDDLQKDAAAAQDDEVEVIESKDPFTPGGKKGKKDKTEQEEAKARRERDQALKAEMDDRLAIEQLEYSLGLKTYQEYLDARKQIQLEAIAERKKLWEEGSKEYLHVDAQEKVLLANGDNEYQRLTLDKMEHEHRQRVTMLHAQFDDENSLAYHNEDILNEMLFKEDYDFLAAKRDLYKEGSLERIEIEWELEEMNEQHKLGLKQRYQDRLLEVQEQYLDMANQMQMDIALNGLEELHRQGLISEEEYQKARLAIQAQYSNAQTPYEKNQKSGAQALKVADDRAKEQTGDSGFVPVVGTIQQYSATMEQLKQMYQQDAINYETYQAAKMQATSKFVSDLSQQIQAAYDTINQIMSAASQYYSACQEYELASVKKKYDKQIEAAGNNQKKVKKLQAKQAKEEAAIKSRYNKRAVKIQIAQAIASTALSAINAYSSAAQVPLVGYILGPLAAAAAFAAGMIQVAAIKKQAAAQEAGYYKGGFTGGKRYKNEAGVVHEGEFVANHKAVNNPNVRPMLNFLDAAQKNNTVGSLTADDVQRGLGHNNGTVVAPVVNVTTDNEDLRQTLDDTREVNQQLLKIIVEKGIKLDFPMDSFSRAFKKYNILNDR